MLRGSSVEPATFLGLNGGVTKKKTVEQKWSRGQILGRKKQQHLYNWQWNSLFQTAQTPQTRKKQSL